MQFHEAIAAALDLLQEEARVLHECSTDANGSWGEDEAAEESYNRMICVIKALRDAHG